MRARTERERALELVARSTRGLSGMRSVAGDEHPSLDRGQRGGVRGVGLRARVVGGDGKGGAMITDDAWVSSYEVENKRKIELWDALLSRVLTPDEIREVAAFGKYIFVVMTPACTANGRTASGTSGLTDHAAYAKLQNGLLIQQLLAKSEGGAMNLQGPNVDRERILTEALCFVQADLTTAILEADYISQYWGERLAKIQDNIAEALGVER